MSNGAEIEAPISIPRPALPAAAPADPEVIGHDELVFVFNFFDELRRIAPTLKR